MSTTVKRIKSATPAYFIRIRFWAAFIGTIMAAATSGLQAVPGIPGWVLPVGGVVTAVCAAIAAFSFLPTTDHSLSDRP